MNHRQNIMRFLFERMLCIRFLLPIIFILGAGSVQAQSWKRIGTFDGYICLAKFLDANTGFVGLGVSPGKNLSGPVELDKTTDGGKTWIKASIPGGYGGQIGDLIMVDPLHGWLAMTAWGGSGNKALWQTTDGGLTWEETRLVGSGTSVQITPNAMIVTDIIGNGHISTDGGNTFSDGFINSTNCVDFIDPMHGVISCYRGESWLYSSDGGVTWQNSNMNIESWSVYDDSGTSNFYAAPEGYTNGEPYNLEIYRSTDYGVNWNPLANFPFVSTGHFAGLGEQYLFFQVQDVNNTIGGVTYNGFYFSTDQGVTWTSIGGPSAHNDTRFSVLNGCDGINLYGFDDQPNGSLYEYSFGSGATGVPSQLHREAASSYFEQVDSLMLGVDINSEINIDSLWPYISDIQFTYTWDSSVAKYAGYLPPSGWTLNGLANHNTFVDINIQNTGSSPEQPMNLGTALFRPSSPQLATSWVNLTNFVVDIGSQSLPLCVTDNEDNHWAVKTLGVQSGVTEVPTVSQDITVYPNPANGNVWIYSSDDLGNVTIEIYDLLGVERGKTEANITKDNPIELTLPDADGVYNLLVKTSAGINSLRVVRNH